MIVLASGSPRRAELLKQIGVEFCVQPTDIDESVLADESAQEYVLRLARQKAEAVASGPRSRVVLGSDTAVVQRGRIFGKPKNKQDFLQTLTQLSGAVHQVFSAVALVIDGRPFSRLSVTDVYFRNLQRSELLDYWQTGEPVDKAGGYAIQGFAATFINRIDGSYSGVMGLPLFETAELIQSCLASDNNA